MFAIMHSGGRPRRFMLSTFSRGILIKVNHECSLLNCEYFSDTNVKRTESILLSKEKLCLYIHESLEHHGSPWKLTIANTSGGGGGE